MYTDFTAKLFLRMIVFSNRLGFCPFGIDKQQGKLNIDNTARAKVIHAWLWLLAYPLIVLPTHMYELHQTGQPKRWYITLVIITVALGGSVILAIASFRPLGICQMANALWKFLPDFEEKFIRKHIDYNFAIFNHVLEALLVLIYLTCVGAGALMGLDSVLRPQDPAYLLFGLDPRFLSWRVILVASSWYSWYCVGFASILGALICNMVLFTAYALQIIKYEMRMGRPRYRTHSSLRSNPRILITTWRAFEVFIRLINSEVMFLLVYLQAGLVFVEMIMAVTLVFQWNTLGVMIKIGLVSFSILIILAWSFILSVFGLLHAWSKETIRSWRRQFFHRRKDWVYLKKIKRSCAPFSVGDGSRYSIRPTSTLTFLNVVSGYSFSALVTFSDIKAYR